jgi:Flp pilus assembly protein TadG
MTNSGLSRNRRGERGITIILVAVTMLFMIMALAAIAIDIVALYTARSQAGHAADAAALAGAKTLANSGMTSDPTNVTLQAAAQTVATQIAKSVATQNKIGGQTVTPGQVSVSFPNAGQPSFEVSPQVSVTVQRGDLPTFFARAAGWSVVPVGSTSVAEAFNPSSSSTVSASGSPIPIRPQCVKPWILPNLDPTNALPLTPLFDTATRAIKSPGMVGKTIHLVPACPLDTGCPAFPPAPAPPPSVSPNFYSVFYYADFGAPPPTSLPASCGLSGCAYEQNIAACNPQPISCGVVATSPNIDTGSCGSGYWNKTLTATQCMIHGPLPGNDKITVAGNPPPFATPLSEPVQFIAGDSNPLVGSGSVAAGGQISTSDSLVTIPVYDGAGAPSTTANIIGFVQGFIIDVAAAPLPPPPTPAGTPNISVVIVNLSGCETGATAPPVLGDGISPVPVHLISQ